MIRLNATFCHRFGCSQSTFQDADRDFCPSLQRIGFDVSDQMANDVMLCQEGAAAEFMRQLQQHLQAQPNQIGGATAQSRQADGAFPAVGVNPHPANGGYQQAAPQLWQAADPQGWLAPQGAEHWQQQQQQALVPASYGDHQPPAYAAPAASFWQQPGQTPGTAAPYGAWQPSSYTEVPAMVPGGQQLWPAYTMPPWQPATVQPESLPREVNSRPRQRRSSGRRSDRTTVAAAHANVQPQRELPTQQVLLPPGPLHGWWPQQGSVPAEAQAVWRQTMLLQQMAQQQQQMQTAGQGMAPAMWSAAWPTEQECFEPIASPTEQPPPAEQQLPSNGQSRRRPPSVSGHRQHPAQIGDNAQQPQQQQQWQQEQHLLPPGGSRAAQTTGDETATWSPGNQLRQPGSETEGQGWSAESAKGVSASLPRSPRHEQHKAQSPSGGSGSGDDGNSRPRTLAFDRKPRPVNDFRPFTQQEFRQSNFDAKALSQYWELGIVGPEPDQHLHQKQEMWERVKQFGRRLVSANHDRLVSETTGLRRGKYSKRGVSRLMEDDAGRKEQSLSHGRRVYGRSSRRTRRQNGPPAAGNGRSSLQSRCDGRPSGQRSQRRGCRTA